MLSDQGASASGGDHQDHGEEEIIRDIHALAPPLPPPLPPPPGRHRLREAWEASSHRLSSLSTASSESENFTSISREFRALVLAGTGFENPGNRPEIPAGNDLGRIGEEETEEETNPLAIVPDTNPVLASPRRESGPASGGELSVQRVQKEEVESKISAWQNEEVAKINNRFKREDAIINGWESEQVQRSTSWMKKVERKLEEKRARATEKMQNEVAGARRKAEERRATAEAKRGMKVAQVLEIASLMRAVGRPPVKRSFF